MTPAAILRAAAARVTDATWCQRPTIETYYTETGPTCAEGHCSRIAYVFDVCSLEAMKTLAMHLGMGGASGAIKWNDAPGRTATEVREAMLAAADAWEREQGKERQHGDL